MVTLFQLQLLPLNKRSEYIWNYGLLLERKTEDRFSSKLYWMGSFYAEVVYNNVANKLEAVVLKQAFHAG